MTTPPQQQGALIPEATRSSAHERVGAAHTANHKPSAVAQSRKKAAPTQAPTADNPASPGIELKPSNHVVDVSALPAALRKELESQIKISGYSQAIEGGEPMAIINDRARQAGDILPSGIKVESITDAGVILSYKGYRFRTGM
jgi:general secretion pathway protein B